MEVYISWPSISVYLIGPTGLLQFCVLNGFHCTRFHDLWADTIATAEMRRIPPAEAGSNFVTLPAAAGLRRGKTSAKPADKMADEIVPFNSVKNCTYYRLSNPKYIRNVLVNVFRMGFIKICEQIRVVSMIYSRIPPALPLKSTGNCRPYC